MKKETLTLANITNDLKSIAYAGMSNKSDWRLSYIFPITTLAVILGIVLRSVFLGLLIFSVAAYHIVCYVKEYKVYSKKIKAIKAVIDRGDISVSVKNFSHIANERIYEPHTHHNYHTHRGDFDATKEVSFFHFMSGSSWRAPAVREYYEWSKDYHISLKGLKNTSIRGDDFFYISLKGHYDIAYIYPCKFFALDDELKSKS